MSPATTSAGMRPATQSELEQAAWTVDALRSVWEHQHDLVSERIGVIDRALRALASGRLDRELRTQALRAAHMLAGSLGMFGFVDAGTAAGELELELARARSEQTPGLTALLERVRDDVRGPVVLCSEVAGESELDV